MNKQRFYRAVMTYAFREDAFDPTFFSKKNEDGSKEYLAKVPLKHEWTKLFLFDGKDTVSIKNRLSDDWTDMITLDAFELAYGGGCHA